MGRVIQFLFSIVIVVFIAAFYALLNIDLNDYKQQIEQAAHDATGRELTLEGDVSLTWSLIPSLQVEHAYFTNASWGSDAHMVGLDKLEVRLALWPLLKREIQVTKVMLNQPVILLETNTKGMGNWVFPEQQPSPPETEEAEGESAIQSVIVNILEINGAKITYVDGVAGQKQQFDIERLSIEAADLKQPMDVLLKAVLDEVPVEIDGSLGGLQALIDNQKTVVDLAAEVAGIDLTVSGEVVQPHSGKGAALVLDINTDNNAIASLLGTDSELPEFGALQIKGHVSNSIDSEAVMLDLTTLLSGLELVIKGQIAEPQNVAGIALDVNLITTSSAIASLAETDVPPVGDITLTGSVTGGQASYALKDLSLKAGESDVSGNIQVALGGDKPSIVMDLHSTLLDLAALSEGEKIEDEKPSDRLFSDDPLVLDGLKQVNAKIDFDAKTIKSSGASLHDVELKVDLTDGHLRLLPLTAGFAGSQIQAEFDLDARNELAQLSTQLQINGFKLTKVEALQDAISGGNTDVFVAAKGQGKSVRALMAGLNGKAVAKVAESQIADGTLDILGADFVTELVNLLNPFSEEKSGTELVCAVVNFKIRNGIATADKGIAVRTGKMNIVGDGTINLKNEKIDIGITPEARTGIGVSLTDLVGLVRVGGTLAEPSALVDKTAVLEAGLSTGAAVATGGLSVVAEGLVDRATADENPCQTALGIKKPASK